MLGLCLGGSVPAWAQTTRQAGLWVDLTAGLAVDSRPPVAGPAVKLGTGAWWGNYDRDYLLGRSWGAGASFRVTGQNGAPTWTGLVEVRRHIDLFVLGLRGRAFAGPERYSSTWLAVAGLGGGLKLRPKRTVGPLVEIDFGAGWSPGLVDLRGTLSLGVEFASPVWRRSRKENTP